MVSETGANTKAERYAGSIEAGPVPVVARVVAVAVVVAIATETAVVRPIAVMPPTRSAVHLIDDEAVLHGSLHALRSRKTNGSGGLRKKPRRNHHGRTCKIAKGFLHGYLPSC